MKEGTANLIHMRFNAEYERVTLSIGANELELHGKDQIEAVLEFLMNSLSRMDDFGL